jgi:Flp pilus assembly protein TadD
VRRKSKKTVPPGKAHAAHSATPILPVAADSRPPEPKSRQTGLNDRWTVLWICLFLAAITLAVFGRTFSYGFVNFDDNDYVYENPAVCGGLTLNGIAAMFTQVECNFYHPLTMISLMVNYQLNGLQPGGYHLANVLLHSLSAILLFLVLRRMTGFVWRSAFVAAVFAIHPLRVESVAWVSERKDVLSGLFFMLTLWAYARYVQNARSGVRYLVVVVLFAMGLLCKPSIVTLPFVMLLLDYWPLRRFGGGAAAGSKLANQRGGFSVFAHLIVEKVPLFALSAAASVIAPMAEGKAMTSSAGVPLLTRLGNPIMSYVTYLRQMIYPADLAPLYPFPSWDLSGWNIILALALLAAISATTVVAWRKRPYLLVGWLWYLGILVPMIGIMQVGGFAHADRFTYLPMIGLSIALTWTVADLSAGWRHRQMVLGGCAITILIALMFCAQTQVSYWQNSESLWTRTLACTSDNYIAHNDLGSALLQKGDVDKAISHFQTALQIKPGFTEAQNNLGTALLQKNNVDEAISHFQAALQIEPDDATAHNNLGDALLQKGDVNKAVAHFQTALQINPGYAEAHYNFGNALLKAGKADEAIVQYQQALQIKPDYAKAHNNLGSVLLQKGDVDRAIAHDQRALQIKPDYAEAHNNLANALLQKGNMAEAIVHYQTALQIKPGFVEVQNNLAWVLATCPQASLRNGNQAVELAQRANQLTGGENPTVLDTLAAAYAEAGRFPEAVQAAQRALQLAAAQSNAALVEAIQSQLKFYQTSSPFHLQ